MHNAHSALCDHCKHTQIYRLHCISSVMLSLCLTLLLLFTSLFSNFSSVMSLQHIQQFSNLSVCCCKLVQMLDLGSDSMQSCRKCVSQGLTCHIDKEFNKCLECMQSIYHKCNLVVTVTEWACVDQKITHLWTELQKTMTRIDHLCKQYNLIQSCKSNMIQHKF